MKIINITKEKYPEMYQAFLEYAKKKDYIDNELRELGNLKMSCFGLFYREFPEYKGFLLETKMTLDNVFLLKMIVHNVEEDPRIEALKKKFDEDLKKIKEEIDEK